MRFPSSTAPIAVRWFVIASLLSGCSGVLPDAQSQGDDAGATIVPDLNLQPATAESLRRRRRLRRDAATTDVTDTATTDSGVITPPPDAATSDVTLVDVVAAVDAVTATDASAATDSGVAVDSGTIAPATTRMYGVTVDNVSNLSAIVTSLSSLPHRPTTRIVFDENIAPTAYRTAVPAIHNVSDVMGEILDSSYVPGITTAGYLSRTSAYLAAFPTGVDIWEVGNEINGNWVDTNAGGAAEVVAKMTGAFDLVRAAGGRTALTLYGCSDADRSHDMLVWATANVPARMRTGLDYVLVSFYEGDCGVAAPDWASAFHSLRAIFPTAALGFGEVGAVTRAGNRITDPAIAGPYLQRYYGMAITEPGYIGGHFWWYYAEDMVPMTSPMWTVLADAIR